MLYAARPLWFKVASCNATAGTTCPSTPPPHKSGVASLMARLFQLFSGGCFIVLQFQVGDMDTHCSPSGYTILLPNGFVS
jgi:hypothetical protein